jgi:hypothetical protein
VDVLVDGGARHGTHPGVRLVRRTAPVVRACRVIITLFISAIVGIESIMVSLLPTWTPVDLTGYENAGLFTSYHSVYEGMQFFNHFIPMDTVLTIFSLSLTIMVALMGYRITVWILTKLHVLGGSSD